MKGRKEMGEGGNIWRKRRIRRKGKMKSKGMKRRKERKRRYVTLKTKEGKRLKGGSEGK